MPMAAYKAIIIAIGRKYVKIMNETLYLKDKAHILKEELVKAISTQYLCMFQAYLLKMSMQGIYVFILFLFYLIPFVSFSTFSNK